MNNLVTHEDIKYTPPKLKLYIDGEYQFLIENETELNNLRVKAMAEEWTNQVLLKWGEQELTIHENGDMSDWPRGMYDASANQLVMMMKIRTKRPVEIKMIHE